MKRLWKAAIAAVGVAVMAGPMLAALARRGDTTNRLRVRQHVARHRRRWLGHDVPGPARPERGLEPLAEERLRAHHRGDELVLGNCVVSPDNPETNTLVNYQHDNVGQAPDVGSSAGISALNGIGRPAQLLRHASARCRRARSTSGPSTGLLPDFARSSRGPRTTGGSATGGNELTSDTFWGFAQDGLEVTVFNARGAQVQAGARFGASRANELYHIWNCDYDTWSEIPSLGIAPGSANDGPIVAWGMNASAGTYATFNTYLINNGGAPAGLGGEQPGVREDEDRRPRTIYSLENDIKQIVNSPDIPALSTVATSPNNPKNWIWWGSFGAFSAYPATLEDGARRYDGDGDRGTGERRPAEHQRHPRQHLPDRSDAVPRHPQERRGLPEDPRRCATSAATRVRRSPAVAPTSTSPVPPPVRPARCVSTPGSSAGCRRPSRARTRSPA